MVFCTSGRKKSRPKWDGFLVFLVSSECFSNPKDSGFLGSSVRLVFLVLPDSAVSLVFLVFLVRTPRRQGAMVPNFAYLYMAMHSSFRSEMPPI